MYIPHGLKPWTVEILKKRNSYVELRSNWLGTVQSVHDETCIIFNSIQLGYIVASKSIRTPVVSPCISSVTVPLSPTTRIHLSRMNELPWDIWRGVEFHCDCWVYCLIVFVYRICLLVSDSQRWTQWHPSDKGGDFSLDFRGNHEEDSLNKPRNTKCAESSGSRRAVDDCPARSMAIGSMATEALHAPFSHLYLRKQIFTDFILL